jgi:hypothetical protein
MVADHIIFIRLRLAKQAVDGRGKRNEKTKACRDGFWHGLIIIAPGVGAITRMDCGSLLSLFADGQSGGKPPHSKMARTSARVWSAEACFRFAPRARKRSELAV